MQPTILYLETSSKNCSVAIAQGETLLCLCEETSENYRQSETLHTFVQWALEGAELTFEALNAVCLGEGPGSYTGLRIGAAAAKGYCFSLGIPLLSVSSAASMAVPFLGKDYDVIISCIDARRSEIYAEVYDGKTGATLQAAQPVILAPDSFAEYRDKKILFVGDGATKTVEITGFSADAEPNILPSAGHLLRLGLRQYEAQEFLDVAYYEPNYLKEFYTGK